MPTDRPHFANNPAFGMGSRRTSDEGPLAAATDIASLERRVDDLAALVSAMYGEIACHLTPALADEVETTLIARGLMSPRERDPEGETEPIQEESP